MELKRTGHEEGRRIFVRQVRVYGGSVGREGKLGVKRAEDVLGRWRSTFVGSEERYRWRWPSMISLEGVGGS